MTHDPAAAPRGTLTGDAVPPDSSRLWAEVAALALPLILFSALLYLAGFWSPWLQGFTTITSGHGCGGCGAVPTGAVSGSAASFTGLLALLHHQPGGSRLIFGWFGWLDVFAMLWDILPFGLIVLSLALWLRKGTSRALFVVYTAWLLFATSVVGVGLYGTFAVLAGDRCEGDCATALFMDHLWVTWGAWLTLGALLLAWIALGLYIRNPIADRSIAASAEDRAAARIFSRSAWVGAGLFTLGVAIWAFGLLVVPWVTKRCAGIPLSVTHFVRGTCSGLDGYDVLSTGMVNGPGGRLGATIWDMGLDPYRIIVLLLFVGAVLATLLWRPGRLGHERWARYTLPVAASAWTMLVAGEFVLGWEGTTERLGQVGAVVFGGPPQVVGPGLWISAAGLVLAVAGAGAGWHNARRRHGDA